MDSYESEAHQGFVRNFLGGRFENSVFCVLTPDGQSWLTRAGRGPEMILGRYTATKQMLRYSLMYPPKKDSSQAIVQDFHSFRQALNVASADQRVLALVHAPAENELKLRESLRSVTNNSQVVGRFHFDFEQDATWKESVAGTSDGHGIVLINPGEFGLKGTVIKRLPLSATAIEIRTALSDSNARFAEITKKKVYSQHVAKGRRQGIYFEGAVPYGEDRDGDGKIDFRN